MLPQDQRLELRGRRPEPHRQQAAEAERIEERSQADHPAGGQGEFLLGEVGEDVDRVTHHEYGRVGPQAVGLDGAEDRLKKLDVAVDEGQPTLIGFAPQPGRDADHVGVSETLITPRMNHLIGDRRRAVEHVECLAIGQIGVRVHDHDLVDNAPQLEREARRGPHDPAAADDADLHSSVPACELESLCR